MPLDPTWVPFCRELWSSAEQQQNYLPGIPEGSDLCVTPVSAPENHYVRINADNSLKADGTLVGKFTISAEGQSDYTPYIHNRIPERMAQYDGKAVAKCISQSCNEEC